MTAFPPVDGLQALSSAISALVSTAAPSVVSLRGHRSAASGFIWRPGLVVTADEALGEEVDVSVALPGGDVAAGKLVGRDSATDIALVRIERTDLTPVALEPVTATAGAIAVVVGADAGAPTVSLGVVSRSGGAWRSLRGGAIDARLELGVVLRRRSEGALVLDAGGRALGMAVFGPRRRVLVIPAQTIARVTAMLETHGRVARGYLGLSLQRVTVAGTDSPGAIVMGVDPKGPAAQVGVRQGDVITAWNGEPLRHVIGLARSLGPESVGVTVTLGILRGGEAREIALRIGERASG